ncbi:MAG TPA: chemotaxis protein CheD [Desulfonatronum sp.]|nr:chemotaxis protein CheD [Desulfonatronum sp.]
MRIDVRISDMKVSNQHGVILTTHSLGSCLGLTAYDPRTRVAGLIHCLLPQPTDKNKAEANPFMFVTTGIPAMIRSMFALGALRERLVLKAVGCGYTLNVPHPFNTGERNQKALLRLLEFNGMSLAASDLGGAIPRTVRLYVDSGEVVIRSRGKEHFL